MADPLRTGASLGARARRRYLEARRAVGIKLRDRLSIDENDSVLARVPLDFEVMVYFTDPPVNLYQVRQWLYPLEQLNKSHPVFILTRDTKTFQALDVRDRAPDRQRSPDRHRRQRVPGERLQAGDVRQPDLPQLPRDALPRHAARLPLPRGEREEDLHGVQPGEGLRLRVRRRRGRGAALPRRTSSTTTWMPTCARSAVPSWTSRTTRGARRRPTARRCSTRRRGRATGRACPTARSSHTGRASSRRSSPAPRTS